MSPRKHEVEQVAAEYVHHLSACRAFWRVPMTFALKQCWPRSYGPQRTKKARKPSICCLRLLNFWTAWLSRPYPVSRTRAG